jgi:hypothetical protein
MLEAVSGGDMRMRGDQKLKTLDIGSRLYHASIYKIVIP